MALYLGSAGVERNPRKLKMPVTMSARKRNSCPRLPLLRGLAIYLTQENVRSLDTSGVRPA
jgi:hypothetical protein